jgi:acyl-CoA synthetase (AMP-forming)/AMP-acid ligase II
MVTGAQLDQPPVTARVRADAIQRHRFVPCAGENHGSTTLVSSGRPITETHVVVVDPETCRRLPAGQIGEIWVCGPGVAKGYWNKQEETRGVFHARLHPAGEGPFLRTGDLGCVQGEELFVTGRIKDVIIIRGRNHYPQDIEATVQETHLALRRGCGAAFGIDVSGQERLVVVQEVERQGSDVPLGEIVGDIRQAIVEVHDVDLHDIVLVRHASIPRTTSGKIRRHACRIAYQDGSLKLPSGPNSSMRGLPGIEQRSKKTDSV